MTVEAGGGAGQKTEVRICRGALELQARGIEKIFTIVDRRNVEPGVPRGWSVEPDPKGFRRLLSPHLGSAVPSTPWSRGPARAGLEVGPPTRTHSGRGNTI